MSLEIHAPRPTRWREDSPPRGRTSIRLWCAPSRSGWRAFRAVRGGPGRRDRGLVRAARAAAGPRPTVSRWHCQGK